MKKKLTIALLAVIIAVAGSVAIYAGVVGFDNEPNYIAAEAVLGCCPVDVDAVRPFGDDWMNGGGAPHHCNDSFRSCGGNNACWRGNLQCHTQPGNTRGGCSCTRNTCYTGCTRNNYRYCFVGGSCLGFITGTCRC